MTQQPLQMSGGFFARLEQLAGGDSFLFWLPVSLMAAAGVLAVLLMREVTREVMERRRQQRIGVARRLQKELNARYGARSAESVRVALRQGGGISEGLYEGDREFYAGMKHEGRRGWEG